MEERRVIVFGSYGMERCRDGLFDESGPLEEEIEGLPDPVACIPADDSAGASAEILLQTASRSSSTYPCRLSTFTLSLKACPAI